MAMNGKLNKQCNNRNQSYYIQAMVIDLLLQQGFLKQELAHYLGINRGKINRLLNSNHAEKILHNIQNKRLIECHRRLSTTHSS